MAKWAKRGNEGGKRGSRGNGVRKYERLFDYIQDNVKGQTTIHVFNGSSLTAM